MDTSKIQAALAAIEKNRLDIATTEAHIRRAAETTRIAEELDARIEELKAERSKIVAEAFMNSQRPDTGVVDDEFKRLDKAVKAESANREGAQAAMPLLRQQQEQAHAAQADLRRAYHNAVRETLDDAIRALYPRIDKQIRAFEELVLEGLAIANLRAMVIPDARPGELWHEFQKYARDQSPKYVRNGDPVAFTGIDNEKKFVPESAAYDRAWDEHLAALAESGAAILDTNTPHRYRTAYRKDEDAPLPVLVEPTYINAFEETAERVDARLTFGSVAGSR